MKVNENNIGYVRHKFTPIKNKLLNKDSKTESKFEQMLTNFHNPLFYLLIYKLIIS